jgi:hypothetical protein
MFQMLAVAALPMMSAFGDTMIYNSNPSPLPGNVPSLGYQANQTAEFGDLIQFAAGPRNLTSATVTMSDWAVESTYEAVGTSAGYNHPLTLNVYNVGPGNTVGSLIGTDTINAFVPWRPEVSAFNGIAFQVEFNFGGLLVPDEVIYGLAYNTNTWGYNPIGLPGPYESLNFGLSTAGASVGSDPLPGTAYWNTMTAANYTDGGAGGVGTFRQDTGWAPYTGAIEFQATAVPEPTGIILLGTLVGALGLLRRRKRAA